MKVTKIHSKNAAYQKLEVLSTNRNKRYKYYEFLVEGVRNINEAIKNGWEIVSLIYAPSLPMSDWAKGVIKSTRTTEGNIELDAPLMQDLSDKEDTSELMAVVKMRPDDPEQIRFKGVPLLALFDRPSNKGNLGTIIRTLDAMGADGLILTGHGVDLYDREVVGASMGSFFNVPVIRMPRHDDLAAFIADVSEKYGALQVVGTTAHADVILRELDLTVPTMFMIGCETMNIDAHCADGKVVPIFRNGNWAF